MKSQRLTLIILVMLGFSLTFSACGGSKEVEYEVELKEFSFTPGSISAPAGATVMLTLNNIGLLEHEFVIMKLGTTATLPFDADDEPNVYWEGEVEPGEKETCEFVAPSEPGEYQVVCGTAGHLEQNMMGKLIVTK